MRQKKYLDQEMDNKYIAFVVVGQNKVAHGIVF